ncbi:Nin1 binding protein [Toensbergia leucococca]|nr:Nin1 binding protein [Toensbergia leucococca]
MDGLEKPVHTIVLDAGPILKNDPSISSLLAKSEKLVTVPSVISEIKDQATRSRVEAIMLPFLEIRIPSVQGVKAITDFARRTGDLAVLSKSDIAVLALAHDIECERNGDWRLRKTPGQKKLNGSPPTRLSSAERKPQIPPIPSDETHEGPSIKAKNLIAEGTSEPFPQKDTDRDQMSVVSKNMSTLEISTSDLQSMNISCQESSKPVDEVKAESTISESDCSDSDGWITPSNIKKYQAKDLNSSTTPTWHTAVMQVAVITTDFAMQNVLLQMNLNLLSPSLQQVRHLRTYILRCHACFEKTKDMSKQFCPRCGKPTLTRVSCSTSTSGEFKIHLKKNMQWNSRGDRFSIPKPVPGVANGKVGTGKGGGKGGWGQELILAEDQKEYIRAMQGQSRRKETDLMDQDYLPSILTGERGRAGGRPKIGAGRNVNSKKR